MPRMISSVPCAAAQSVAITIFTVYTFIAYVSIDINDKLFMTEKENEVALSSTILESLGVTPKIGEEVTLTWEVNPMLKQYKTDTFQICGFWQGASFGAHPVFVFKEKSLCNLDGQR